jgi:hypothetical protein
MFSQSSDEIDDSAELSNASVVAGALRALGLIPRHDTVIFSPFDHSAAPYCRIYASDYFWPGAFARFDEVDSIYSGPQGSYYGIRIYVAV